MKDQELNKLVEEALTYAGTSAGREALEKYEIIKLETERKRNKYLFAITIILAAVAVMNFILEVIKFNSN